jgi:cation transport ATPase
MDMMAMMGMSGLQVSALLMSGSSVLVAVNAVSLRFARI